MYTLTFHGTGGYVVTESANKCDSCGNISTAAIDLPKIRKGLFCPKCAEILRYKAKAKA